MTTTRKNTDTNTRLQRSAKLDELELTGSSPRNILINNVKQMFQKGAIRRADVAEGLIKLIQENILDEFDEKFSKIAKAETHEQQSKGQKK